MRVLFYVLLFCGYLLLNDINGKPIRSIYCPLCDMVVEDDIKHDIKGNQTIYACVMAGHIDELQSQPKTYLRSAVPAKVEDPYKPGIMSCPVCGKKELNYAVPWGPKGNQKIFTCSEDHAKRVLAEPKIFMGTDSGSVDGFCERASIMFSGFQSSIHATCSILLFPAWILNTEAKYTAGFLGTILLVILMDWVGEYREKKKANYLKKHGVLRHGNETSNSYRLYPFSNERKTKIVLPLVYRVRLSVYYMIHITLAYFVMLIVMTYETGLFISVLIGVGVAFLLFKEVEEGKKAGSVDPCCAT